MLASYVLLPTGEFQQCGYLSEYCFSNFLSYVHIKYNSLVLWFLESQKFNAVFLKSVLELTKDSLSCF